MSEPEVIEEDEVKPCILVVDDTPANIQVLALVLKDKYRIKVATSGPHCLEQVRGTDKPDLILLDIMMPGMDGFEVCEELKADPSTSKIPVIFITGRQDTHDEQKGFEVGAVDYITKPIRPVIVAARVKTHITIVQQQKELKSMALHDQLTGLYNRHFLIEMAEQKVASALRHKDDLSILMVDIDHFKNINDTHGHQMGDTILQLVGRLLGNKYRKDDVVSVRFGGEEFVVLLNRCDLEQATICAEKIRQDIEDLKPEGLTVTVSIGTASLKPSDNDFTTLLQRADDALYQAKDLGRNRVVSDSDTAS